MADQPSLADRAVHALALVAAMDSTVTSDSPERHIVWDLKNHAEQTLSAAFSQALRLSYLAGSARRVVQEVTDEAKKAGERND